MVKNNSHRFSSAGSNGCNGRDTVRTRQTNEFLMPERQLKKIIDKYFISPSNGAKFSELSSRIVDMGLDFKLARNGSPQVIDYKEQPAIMADLLEPVPLDGIEMRALLEEINAKIVSGSVNFSSPGFIAFPDSGNAIASVSGHMLSGLLNQNLINSKHTSPTATFVEMAVINWLREIVGFEVKKDPNSILDVGGVNVPGGVLANTIGMLIARENRFPGTLKNGISFDPRKVKVFIPAGISHYSSRAALGWLGLGTDSMIDVKTTDSFRMDQSDLKRKIQGFKKEGAVPLALVAYCGDSRTMAIDEFASLSAIAKRYGMWLHIDACHGLSLCFSERLMGRVKDLRLADSITIDPHKVLFTPYALSYACQGAFEFQAYRRNKRSHN